MPATYDPPTPNDFKTRFPIFADESDDRVQLFLDEASTSVDKAWAVADYRPAWMYLAAHLLATDGSSEDDSVQMGAAGQGVVAGESFGGGLSVTYAVPTIRDGSLSANDKYGTTEWGRRYYALLLRNRRGPLVV